MQYQAGEEDRKGRLDLLTKIFFIGVIIVAILNGSAFWLKRVGWLEPELHRYYWLEYKYEFRDDVTPIAIKNEYLREKLRIFTAKLYKTKGSEIVLKLSKDIFFVLFLACSALLVKNGANRIFADPLLTAFLLLVGYGFARSWFLHGPVFALAGLRTFMFLGVAALGWWATRKRNFAFLASILFLLVFCEWLLVPIELKRGVHLFAAQTSRLIGGDRVVGTFLQPSSLAVATGFCLAFYYAYSAHRRWFVALAILAGTIIFFTGSGIGAVIYAMVLFRALWKKLADINIRIPLWLPLAGGILFVFFLPEIARRPFVYDSLWGRIQQFQNNMFAASGLVDVLFGKGLGVATNVTANLLVDWQAGPPGRVASDQVFIADSMPLSVGLQLGWLGIFLLYLLLLRAAWRDRQAWGVYGVIFLASLTMNIQELFPVNFILGLLLARNLRTDPATGSLVTGQEQQERG